MILCEPIVRGGGIFPGVWAGVVRFHRGHYHIGNHGLLDWSHEAAGNLSMRPLPARALLGSGSAAYGVLWSARDLRLDV